MQFVRNVATNYMVTAVDLVLLIVLTPLIVHSLGIEHYSVWIIVQTLGFYLGFLDIGLPDAQVRQHARLRAAGSDAEIARLHGTANVIFLIAGIAGLLLSALAFFVPLSTVLKIPSELTAIFPVILLLIALDNLLDFLSTGIDGIYEGEERFDLLNIIGIATSIAESALIAIVLWTGYGLIALLVVSAVVTAVEYCIKYWLVPAALPGIARPNYRFNGASWRSIRSFSIWNSLNEFMTEGTAHLDKLLIPILLTGALVTPYALVLMVAAVIFAVAEPITDTFLPIFSKHSGKNSRKAMRSALMRGTRLVITVTLPVTLAVVLFGDSILNLWIGEEYTDIDRAVLWFTAANFFFSTILWTPLNLLLGAGSIKYIFWASCLEVLLALALILLLVPIYALTGLAIAGLVANVATGLAFFIPRACQIAGVSTYSYLRCTLWRPTIAALPLLALGFVFVTRIDTQNWTGAIGGSVGIACLTFSAMLLFVLPISERMRWYASVRQLLNARR